MCAGGGGGGGDGGAAAAAAQESARRAAIKKGTEEVNRIFGGYTRGRDAVAGAPAAGQTYYLEDGTAVTVRPKQVANPAYTQAQQSMRPTQVMPDSAAGNWSMAPYQNSYVPTNVPQMISQDMLYGADGREFGVAGSMPLYGGMESVGGFDDNFYSGLEQKYLDYANPQLQSQYDEARRQAEYELEDRGLTSSTAAGNRWKKLEEQYDKYRTDVASAAKGYAQRTRGDIENARTNLINQVSLTEDPAAAASGAVRVAAQYSEPPAFDPLGQFVFDVGQGLQAESARRGYQPLFGAQLFGKEKKNGSISYVN